MYVDLPSKLDYNWCCIAGHSRDHSIIRRYNVHTLNRINIKFSGVQTKMQHQIVIMFTLKHHKHEQSRQSECLCYKCAHGVSVRWCLLFVFIMFKCKHFNSLPPHFFAKILNAKFNINIIWHECTVQPDDDGVISEIAISTAVIIKGIKFWR